MSIMLLSPDERDRFALYLEQDAASDQAMAEQAEKINQSVLAKKLKAEAAAARIVARKLRLTEDASISG